VKLQLGDGAAQRGAQLLQRGRVCHHLVGQHGVGVAKTRQQVFGGVVQQAFEAMQVVHDHQQGVLHLGRNHHGYLHRRPVRHIERRLHRFSIAAGCCRTCSLLQVPAAAGYSFVMDSPASMVTRIRRDASRPQNPNCSNMFL